MNVASSSAAIVESLISNEDLATKAYNIRAGDYIPLHAVAVGTQLFLPLLVKSHKGIKNQDRPECD